MTTAPQAKRLSSVEWATVCALYERGEKNTRELAEQFGVSRQAIEQGLRQRDVKRNARSDEVRGEIEDAAREEHKKRIAEANKLKTDYAGYMKILTGMALRKLTQAEANGQDVSAVNAQMVTIGNAMKIVAKAQERTWEILDIKNLTEGEDELPDLNVGEYTPDEIEGIKDAIEEAYQDQLNEPEDDDADTEE